MEQNYIIITNSFQILMYNHRPNLDFESILDQVPTPNRLRAPTPVMKGPMRVVPNKQNIMNQGNQWMNQYINQGAQKRLIVQDNFNRKPLISPVRNPFKTQIQTMYRDQKRGNRIIGRQPQQFRKNEPTCVNHPDKIAQFNIDLEDESLAYCGRCAAQLASQGFQVTKMQDTVKKGDYKDYIQQDQPKPRALPRYPQYQGNPHYQLIIKFLSELTQVQSQHLQNMSKLSNMDNHYSEQIQQTKDFYTELLSFIEQMRDDHLNDLYEQSRKHSQIADIEHDYLRENAEQIGNIRNDIEQNLETIVEKINEEDLRNNLNYYKQKVQVYRHKVEEQSEFFDQVINFSPQQYELKLTRAQDFLMDVWKSQSEEEPQQQKFSQKVMQTQPRTSSQRQPQYLMKAPNQIYLSKNTSQPQNMKKLAPNSGSQNQNQPAFRKLFEQEEPIMAETSPQFKKI